jgi:hypothetical protein
MTDDKLAKLAFEIDDIIAALSIKHKIEPLSLTSVILARLVLANDFTGSGDDFRKIMFNIPNPRIPSNEAVH